MKKTFIFIFTIFIAISSCKKSEDTQLYGNIKGIITDAITNEPIQGALITLSPTNSSKLTGTDGKYEFISLESTNYTIQASKNGYITNVKTVTVEPDLDRNGDISLTRIIPILNTSVTSLDFGSNLNALPISITNIGKGILNWNINENIDWISCNPIQGSITTETGNLIVSVDRTNLNPGNYSQSIIISSNGGNATINISVTKN
ncbi:MAG: carboxypeptidase regulatory-like domain-containing protein [Bacteroidia bacterium]